MARLFFIKHSFPGRNFERNQLLNVSMSISPLYKNESINLHVRTQVEPPPRFLWASFSSCKDQHLSGCKNRDLAQSRQIINQARLGLLAFTFIQLIFFTFISQFIFSFYFFSTLLSLILHSLIRVSRRVG